MNINTLIIMRYSNFCTWWEEKTNPIQSQFKPNLSQFKPNLTQYKPNSKPISPVRRRLFSLPDRWYKSEKTVTFGANGGTYIQYLLRSYPGKGRIKYIEGGSPVSTLDEGDEMRIAKFIWKCWRGLWRPCHRMPTGINSHKWESKIEILRNLSSKRH